jgi:hypothetical protein
MIITPTSFWDGELGKVDRKEYAVEVETAQGFKKDSRALVSMPGDADIIGQTFITGFDQSFEGASHTGHLVEFVEAGNGV